MATRSTTNIKRRSYRALYRTPAAVSVPADAAAWTTLLATFTEFGYLRKPSLEAPIEKGDVEELDDDNEITLSYNLSLKFTLLQTGDNENTEYTSIDGTNQDVMLVDENALRAVIYKNVVVDLFDSIKGNETDSWNAEISKKNAADKADIRVIFDIPTS